VKRGRRRWLPGVDAEEGGKRRENGRGASPAVKREGRGWESSRGRRMLGGGAEGGVRATGNGRAQRRREPVGRRTSGGRRGVWSGGPCLEEREGACGPHLENVGRPGRREMGRAQRNSESFDLFTDRI
jgi:hypothetical protein